MRIVCCYDDVSVAGLPDNALNDAGERDFLSIVGVIDCDIGASSLYTESPRTDERRYHFQCNGGVSWT